MLSASPCLCLCHRRQSLIRMGDISIPGSTNLIARFNSLGFGSCFANRDSLKKSRIDSESSSRTISGESRGSPTKHSIHLGTRLQDICSRGVVTIILLLTFAADHISCRVSQLASRSFRVHLKPQLGWSSALPPLHCAASQWMPSR